MALEVKETTLKCEIEIEFSILRIEIGSTKLKCQLGLPPISNIAHLYLYSQFAIMHSITIFVIKVEKLV